MRFCHEDVSLWMRFVRLRSMSDGVLRVVAARCTAGRTLVEEGTQATRLWSKPSSAKGRDPVSCRLRCAAQIRLYYDDQNRPGTQAGARNSQRDLRCESKTALGLLALRTGYQQLSRTRHTRRWKKRQKSGAARIEQGRAGHGKAGSSHQTKQPRNQQVDSWRSRMNEGFKSSSEIPIPLYRVLSYHCDP